MFFQDFCSKDEKYIKPKPFVPVQSEPFKVFDDKDNAIVKVYEDKLVEETSVVLRETRDTREIQIKQVTEISVKAEREKPTLEVNPSTVSIVQPFRALLQEKRDEPLFSPTVPMSLEKSLTFLESGKKQDSKSKREACKTLKDSFYDVDEYRADIYNYLRIAEVLNLSSQSFCHNSTAGKNDKNLLILHNVFVVLDSAQTKAWVHEETTGHNLLHEIYSRGLAGRGRGGISASQRDVVSRCFVH